MADGIGNCDVVSTKQISLPKHDAKNYFQGFWKISYDGGCSKSRNGVGVVFKIHQYGIHPHAIRLELSCT
jgi:hypothetical protein